MKGKRLLLFGIFYWFMMSAYHAEARYYDARVGRWMSVDQLSEKYPSTAPYSYVADNPITKIDPNGKEIVDSKGRRVDVLRRSNGELTFSRNASSDVRRIARAMNASTTGRERLDAMTASPTKVHLNLSPDSKTTTDPTGRTTIWNGQTIQGNDNPKDAYGRVQKPDGTISLKEATITIFVGGIQKNLENPNSPMIGLTVEQAIGATASHESVHAVDPVEVNKDLQYEKAHNGEPRPDREVKANEVKQQVIEESKRKE